MSRIDYSKLSTEEVVKIFKECIAELGTMDIIEALMDALKPLDRIEVAAHLEKEGDV